MVRDINTPGKGRVDALYQVDPEPRRQAPAVGSPQETRLKKGVAGVQALQTTLRPKKGTALPKHQAKPGGEHAALLDEGEAELIKHLQESKQPKPVRRQPPPENGFEEHLMKAPVTAHVPKVPTESDAAAAQALW